MSAHPGRGRAGQSCTPALECEARTLGAELGALSRVGSECDDVQLAGAGAAGRQAGRQASKQEKSLK